MFILSFIHSSIIAARKTVKKLIFFQEDGFYVTKFKNAIDEWNFKKIKIK